MAKLRKDLWEDKTEKEARESVGEVFQRMYNEDSSSAQDNFEHLQGVIINSKSGPFTDEDGELRPSDGGVASGTHPVANKTDATWVHLGSDADQKHVDENGEMKIDDVNYTAVPKFFEDEIEDGFYYDVSNMELWPIMHDMPENFHAADEDGWEAYRKVNQEFAEEINRQVDNSDPVWVHDYQNMLVPEMVREDNEESPIIYTHHIPVPDIEDGDTNFKHITEGEELLGGLSAADVIGVHTNGDRENLLNIIEEYGGDVDYEKSIFEFNGHEKTKVANVPLGVDHQRYSEIDTDELERRMSICEELGDQNNTNIEYASQFNKKTGETDYQDELNLIFAPARADYTKGLDQLIDAYEIFQERNPKEAERTKMVLKPTPTREEIEEYAELWDDISTRGEENEGIDLRTDWVEHDELVELYRASDVIATPSYKDGMNLVAKEGVAANATGDYPGNLLIGEKVGAAEQLGENSILVDPRDPEEMSYRLEEAFNTGYSEREENMESMLENVQTYDVEWWTQEYDNLAGLAKQLRS